MGRTKSLLVVIGLLGLALPATAEAPEGTGPRMLRFLPVGDAPPFRQVIRDGVRYELEAPPGSIPPRRLTSGPGGDPSAAIALRLGFISAAVTVAPGDGRFTLFRQGDDEESEPWLRIRRPASGDALVFLWRDPASGSWDHVSHLTVPDGEEGAPAGTLRIANLFPGIVGVDWAGERIAMKPATSIRRTMKPGEPVLLRIFATGSSGRPSRYFSGEVEQNTGERGLVVIYRADGAAPRRPLKVLTLREPVAPAGAGDEDGLQTRPDTPE